MRGRAAISLLALTTLVPAQASAEPVQLLEIHAASSDGPKEEACHVSYDSAEAAVHRTLDAGHVAVGTTEDYFHDRALRLDFYLDTRPIGEEFDEHPDRCAVDVQVHLGTFTLTVNPVAKNLRKGEINYCRNDQLIVEDVAALQQKVEALLAGFTKQCLAEYARGEVQPFPAK